MRMTQEAKTKNELRPQIILTWISWSGKTTLMKGLLEKYPALFAKPTQYTTRAQRHENELDDYVFLSPSQFTRKLINGDFIEYTEYNKELYSIWRYYDETKSNIFIAEPVGREALQRHFKINNIPFKTFYIKIPKEEMQLRLESRRSSIMTINERMKDLKYFYPLPHDHLLDGTDRPESLVLEVKKQCDL